MDVLAAILGLMVQSQWRPRFSRTRLSVVHVLVVLDEEPHPCVDFLHLLQESPVFRSVAQAPAWMPVGQLAPRDGVVHDLAVRRSIIASRLYPNATSLDVSSPLSAPAESRILNFYEQNKISTSVSGSFLSTSSDISFLISSISLMFR